jgi:hypothetical protein
MSDTRIITLAELREHSTKDNLWVLLHEKGAYFPVLPITRRRFISLYFCLQSTMSQNSWTRFAADLSNALCNPLILDSPSTQEATRSFWLKPVGRNQ